MCRLLPKSASATIGRRHINRIGFFLVLPSLPGFLFFNVITRRCPFLSLPDFFFIYVIARLDRAICLSPPSDFPDTPVKPEYDNNKGHYSLVCVISQHFPLSVIARLDRAIHYFLSRFLGYSGYAFGIFNLQNKNYLLR